MVGIGQGRISNVNVDAVQSFLMNIFRPKIVNAPVLLNVKRTNTPRKGNANRPHCGGKSMISRMHFNRNVCASECQCMFCCDKSSDSIIQLHAKPWLPMRIKADRFLCLYSKWHLIIFKIFRKEQRE